MHVCCSESRKEITDEATSSLKPATTTTSDDNTQSQSDLDKQDIVPTSDTASSSNQQDFDDFDDDEDDLSANFKYVYASTSVARNQGNIDVV